MFNDSKYICLHCSIIQIFMTLYNSKGSKTEEPDKTKTNFKHFVSAKRFFVRM